MKTRGRLRVAGLVLGDGFLAHVAHRTGYADGRVSGPWLFRLLFAHATRRARFVPADNVLSWERGTIELDVRGEELAHVAEAEGR